MTFTAASTEINYIQKTTEDSSSEQPFQRDKVKPYVLISTRHDSHEENSSFAFPLDFLTQIPTHAPHPKIAPGIAALMLAVLNDAIVCIQKGVLSNNVRTQLLSRQAEAWMESPEETYPFSFVSICTALGITPGYIRLGLKKWKQQPSVRPPRKMRYNVRSLRPLHELHQRDDRCFLTAGDDAFTLNNVSNPHLSRRERIKSP